MEQCKPNQTSLCEMVKRKWNKLWFVIKEPDTTSKGREKTFFGNE